MCDACKYLSKIWDPVQNIMVSYIVNQINYHPTFIVASEKGAISFEANFCPWCGRKLDGKKEK